MKEPRKVIRRYAITTAVASAMFFLVLWTNDYWNATALVDKYRILSNGFTVPGVILIMLTALVRLSGEGAFDGLGYVFRHAAKMLVPSFKKEYKHETYYDYVKNKGEKKPHGYSCMFFVGIVFVLAAVVFVFLHSSVYVG